jgi:glycine/D-amino acid oxidase-like deaminating enzyme
MDAEVVVVGAGIVGANIALQLARRAVGDVLLLDERGPAAGMSGRSFRQVRTHYSNISPLHPAATPRPLRFAYGPGARA